MYNLYDKYLRGNSIGCYPLYVSYYLHYVLTWELNRYGRRTTTTDDDGHTLNHSNMCIVPSPIFYVLFFDTRSFHYIICYGSGGERR